MKYLPYLFLMTLASCGQNKAEFNGDLKSYKGTVTQVMNFIIPTASAASTELCSSRKSPDAINYLEVSTMNAKGELVLLCSTDIDSNGNYDFKLNPLLIKKDTVLFFNAQLNGNERSHIVKLDDLAKDNDIGALSTAVSEVNLQDIKAGKPFSKENSALIKETIKAAIIESELDEKDFLSSIKKNEEGIALIRDAVSEKKKGNISAASAKIVSVVNKAVKISDDKKIALKNASINKESQSKIAAAEEAAANAAEAKVIAAAEAASKAAEASMAEAKLAAEAAEKAVAEKLAAAEADAKNEKEKIAAKEAADAKLKDIAEKLAAAEAAAAKAEEAKVAAAAEAASKEAEAKVVEAKFAEAAALAEKVKIAKAEEAQANADSKKEAEAKALAAVEAAKVLSIDIQKEAEAATSAVPAAAAVAENDNYVEKKEESAAVEEKSQAKIEYSRELEDFLAYSLRLTLSEIRQKEFRKFLSEVNPDILKKGLEIFNNSDSKEEAIKLMEEEGIPSKAREALNSNGVLAIRDDRTGENVSNSIALEFLTYALQMSAENVKNKDVQKFLSSHDMAYLAKPLNEYQYGVRSRAIDFMEKYSIGPKARDIVNADPVKNTWLVVLKDNEKEMNVSQRDLENFLVSSLQMKIEEIRLQAVQEFLAGYENLKTDKAAAAAEQPAEDEEAMPAMAAAARPVEELRLMDSDDSESRDIRRERMSESAGSAAQALNPTNIKYLTEAFRIFTYEDKDKAIEILAEKIAPRAREIAKDNAKDILPEIINVITLHDGKSDTDLSNNEALEFLVYSLRMTAENVQNVEVQKFLAETVRKEIIAKALNEYLYNDKGAAIEIMEADGAAPKAREIVKADIVNSSWILIVRDEKSGKLVSQKVLENILSTALGLKPEDIRNPSLQEYLSSDRELMVKAYHILTYGSDDEKNEIIKHLAEEVAPKAQEIIASQQERMLRRRAEAEGEEMAVEKEAAPEYMPEK